MAAAGRRSAVARAARRFLTAGDPSRETALALLPGVTGFGVPMVREALSRIFGEIDEGALDRATAGAAEVHPVVGIVSAGNVPGVAVPKMALALAAGAACFVKPSGGEPLLAALFAAALASEAPAFSGAVAVAWWRGGTSSCDAALARGVDSLVAYGSEEAVAALHALGPAAFTGYGHRLSVGLVRLERTFDVAAAAREAALDVALYDQLGCLSPQCLFVTGDRRRRRELAGALGAALARLAVELPRGTVPSEAAMAIRRRRDEIEWREIAGEDVRLVASAAGTDWTVIDECRPGFRPGPLYRTIPLVPLAAPGDLSGALGEAAGLVECLGVHPFPDPEAAAAAGLAGIPSVVPLGRMQRPPLERHAGGLAPLAGIARDR